MNDVQIDPAERQKEWLRNDLQPAEVDDGFKAGASEGSIGSSSTNRGKDLDHLWSGKEPQPCVPAGISNCSPQNRGGISCSRIGSLAIARNIDLVVQRNDSGTRWHVGEKNRREVEIADSHVIVGARQC